MTVNYKDMTEEETLAPEFYAKGDLPWIRAQLMFLEFEDKKTACAEYREIYLVNCREKSQPEARDMANSYLQDYVDRHGVPGRIKLWKEGVIPEPLKRRIERIKRVQLGERKTIIGMSEK